ncbi:MAG TPA: FRG domain-containing protein [Micromonosporaceae bacterium]|nr:FRG domain-containing protein [Micromonosporaceae bacterium]
MNAPELTPVSVDSVGALVDVVTRLSDGGEHILWYRGQRDAAWGIWPAIHRHGYVPDDERNLTNRFRSRAAMRHPQAPPYEDRARWLSLMQHYGLPTRLLDWTRSPLIAAYFAVEHCLSEADDPAPGADAAIWVLRPHSLNQYWGKADVTPSIDAVMCRPLLAPAFSDRDPETGLVRAVMASETDLRMFVQQGCFTVHSDPTPLNQLPGHGRFLEVLVIPSERVATLAREIYASGFRQGDIFPDLGHLAAELRYANPPR